VFEVVEHAVNPYSGRMNRVVHGRFKTEMMAHARWQQLKLLGMNVGIESR